MLEPKKYDSFYEQKIICVLSGLIHISCIFLEKICITLSLYIRPVLALYQHNIHVYINIHLLFDTFGLHQTGAGSLRHWHDESGGQEEGAEATGSGCLSGTTRWHCHRVGGGGGNGARSGGGHRPLLLRRWRNRTCQVNTLNSFHLNEYQMTIL